ncbi:MAG TPA: hypothetical protein PK395_05915 [bacterium]|nr:hypothetical protein [bacterium]
MFPRREFLKQAGLTAGCTLALQNSSVARVEQPARIIEPFLEEYGFWDYTAPVAGGMEQFGPDDYRLLLDDMREAGMNSLVICIKWLTTGYYSRLPFQDQFPGNPVIESKNELIRQVIQETHQRKIKIRFNLCLTYFDAEVFGGTPYNTFDNSSGVPFPRPIGVYDTDAPGLVERACQVCEEVVEEFPGVDGYVIELEGAGVEVPHRIDRYNQWAKEHGKRPFSEIGHPLDPRGMDAPEWREYTTFSRFKVLRAVEEILRGKGFDGDLFMICETGNTDYGVYQEVHLRNFHAEFPHWGALTYEYEKWNRRYAMMELCIAQPKTEGMQVFYLPRGVMTWGRWPFAHPLQESWKRDIEDILMLQPHGVWWFGCGTVNDGAHVGLKRLREVGFKDGVDARRELICTAEALSESVSSDAGG